MGTVSDISKNLPGRPNPDTGPTNHTAPTSLEIRIVDRRLLNTLAQTAVVLSRIDLAELETTMVIEQNRLETETLQDLHLAESPDAATWSPDGLDLVA